MTTEKTGRVEEDSRRVGGNRIVEKGKGMADWWEQGRTERK